MKNNLKPIYELFEKFGKEIKFSIGQCLCSDEYLPGQILLIKSGNARLIGKINGKPIALKKLGPGEIIGMASILKGQPCEEVRASQDLIALSLRDNYFQESYLNKFEIKKSCDTNLWEAELIFLLKNYLEGNLKGEISPSEYLKLIFDQSQIITSISSLKNNNLMNEKKIFCSSSYGKLEDKLEINNEKELENFLKKDSIFSPRAILLNEKKIKLEFDYKLVKKDIKKQKVLPTIEEAPILPPKSNLNKFIEDQKILIKGEGSIEGTIACFQILSNIIDFPFRRDAIEKGLKEYLKDNQFVTLQYCAKIALYHGLQVNISKISTKVASRIITPALIPWKNSFAVLVESKPTLLKIASPSEGFLTIELNNIEKVFEDGIDVLLLEKTNLTQEKKFSFSWFLPFIRNYKSVLIQVLIAGFVIQLFTLANPLLIQVIIDKVITQRSLDTLQVLGIALFLVTILEGILTGLKTFLLSETTNRIDQKLASQVINHLLSLPLNFFQNRPTGELSSRIGELEKIRTFLTSQAFSTILDLIFSLIYIFVMLLYSVSLTLISLLVLPIQVFITLIGAPLFRRQFRNVAEANAKTQSHLVEILNGIETVKAQNVENVSRWKWQDLYSRYINSSFEKTITGTTLVQLSQVLQKISQLFVLWMGAGMVLQGSITLGQLIAFRIISGYVTQPLLRLSTIWQNVQELKVSFERLADVIDSPGEKSDIEKSKISIPEIKGSITFENINFNFLKNTKPILENINLSIKEDHFIGVVGQSGSGKSTLMKLLPRLYNPDSGRILIDGYDIQKVELDSLRNQIGIVPQEPLLFSGTIRENISLANPEINEEEIINVAKLANAHDFIMELPDGYSSKVLERGSSLSGGQKQRITIARTLLKKPKILILDEATSALDYESEKKVCSNLLNNVSNCTVFAITHRLSSIKNADSIIMMHKGKIDEVGTHKELIKKRGRYFALYQQQESN